MIVTEARYRTITRDISTASDPVTAALEDAQRLVEDACDRPFDHQETTETLTIYADAWQRPTVAPRRTPVTAVPADSGLEITPGGVELVGASPAAGVWWATGPITGEVQSTVTFTGGYKPWGEADHVVPVDLERAIVFVAQGLLRETVPVGVTGGTGVRQATVGDVTVVYAEVGEGLDRYAAGIHEVIERYRWCPYL